MLPLKGLLRSCGTVQPVGVGGLLEPVPLLVGLGLLTSCGFDKLLGMLAGAGLLLLLLLLVLVLVNLARARVKY